MPLLRPMPTLGRDNQRRPARRSAGCSEFLLLPSNTGDLANEPNGIAESVPQNRRCHPRTTRQPERNVTRSPEAIYDDIWLGRVGTLLGIRRHFISLALPGRGVMGCYCALFCPDNRRTSHARRLGKVLCPHDLSGRIGLRQWNVIVHWRAELTDSVCPINSSSPTIAMPTQREQLAAQLAEYTAEYLPLSDDDIRAEMLKWNVHTPGYRAGEKILMDRANERDPTRKTITDLASRVANIEQSTAKHEFKTWAFWMSLSALLLAAAMLAVMLWQWSSQTPGN